MNGTKDHELDRPHEDGVGSYYQTCKRCLFNITIAKIHDDGICEYCKLHDELEAQADPAKFADIIVDIKNSGRDKKYDCLIGISGGADSTVLLYLAKFVWRLRPLVIHMDNRWNGPEAKHNLQFIIDYCNVNAITYQLDRLEYDELNNSFLAAGLPDADIPNDIAMTKLMYETAAKYGIKWILNGHDFRNEGSTPAKWTYMDARYIKSVFRKWQGRELVNYPLLTFWDQIFYGLIGIKQVRPFHYDRHNYDLILDSLKSLRNGWKDYGAKHSENIYTEFVGSWLLPDKFGIDKRIVYLSAKIRSGQISKQDAKEILKQTPEFDFSKLGHKADRILALSTSKIGRREDYDHYDFKKWRWVIWILAKMKVVPYTFYKKYCL